MGFMLVLIVVLLYGAWRGWRTGLVHQLAGMLGMAFGVVVARMFYAPVGEWITDKWPSLAEGFAAEYRVRMLAMALLFAGAYVVLGLGAGVLRQAMSVLRVGVLNSMAGAAFSLLKWVMIMSVVYNVILAVSPGCRLADYCDDGDGNLVELVMAAAPALMGGEGPCELEHKRKMEEARSISAAPAREDINDGESDCPAMIMTEKCLV